MSFLFPKRTYRHIKRIVNQLSTIKPLAYVDSTPYPDLSPIISIMDEISKKEEIFDQETAGLGWFLSFIPGTKAYESRIAFSNAIEKNRPALENFFWNYNQEIFPQVPQKLYNFFLSTSALPSWGKVIFFTMLMLLSLGIAILGTGALLSFLGISIVNPAVILFAQLGFTFISTIASTLGVGIFGLSIAAIAIGSFFAALSFSELHKPGSTFRLLGFSRYDIAWSPIFNSTQPTPLWAFIPVIGPILNLRNLPNIPLQEKQLLREHLIKDSINPISILIYILGFPFGIAYKLIDLGTNARNYASLPRSIAKILIGFPVTIINILLSPLEELFNLPIDAALYLSEKCSSDAEKNKTSNNQKEDVSVQKRLTDDDNNNIITTKFGRIDLNNPVFKDMPPKNAASTATSVPSNTLNTTPT